MQAISCCFAMVVICGVSTVKATDDVGTWVVEHRKGIWALSYKQTAATNNAEVVASELTFSLRSGP